MALLSSSVASTTFKVVKKGYDPDEVRAYLKEVAGALKSAQDHAVNVEARARQAVARAQEAAQTAQAQASTPDHTKLDDTETISRTLLLAQKTADETVGAATEQAALLRSDARAEADRLVREASQEAGRLAEGAQSQARAAGEAERVKVESELQQLLARLEFLRDDVAQMEGHAAHHRERIAQVAADLQLIAERQSAGLGEIRRPVLSAAADLSSAELIATQAIPVVGTTPLPGFEAAEVAVRATADAGRSDGSDAPTPETRSWSSPRGGEVSDPDITAEVPITE